MNTQTTTPAPVRASSTSAEHLRRQKAEIVRDLFTFTGQSPAEIIALENQLDQINERLASIARAKSAT